MVYRGIAVFILSCSVVVAEQGGSATAYAAEAQHALRQGEYKRAERFYRKAIGRDSTNSLYHDGLGRSLERQAESASFPVFLTAKAKKSFTRALELDPRNVEALQDLIDLAQQPVGLCEGNLDEAAALIERMRQVDRDAAERAAYYLADARRESSRLGQQVMCSPLKVTRAVTDRFAPPVVLNSETQPRDSQAAVLAKR